MQIPDKSKNSINTANKAAWDSLYAKTVEPIWGDTPLPFLKQIEGHLRQNLEPETSILDGAAGEGRNLPFLLSLYNSVTACDASLNALKKIPASLQQQVRIQQCDLSETLFEDNEFGLILLADVVETLPNALEVLREMHRILKPNGIIVCNIPGIDDGISEDTMTPFGEKSFLYQENYFYHFYDQSEATDLMRKAGFEVSYSEEFTWEESAHPEFRRNAHTHCSLILIVNKAS